MRSTSSPDRATRPTANLVPPISIERANLTGITVCQTCALERHMHPIFFCSCFGRHSYDRGMNQGWAERLRTDMSSAYFRSINEPAASERVDNLVFPADDEIFRCLAFLKPEETKVVIIGQDPYHGPARHTGSVSPCPLEFLSPCRCATSSRNWLMTCRSLH